MCCSDLFQGRATGLVRPPRFLTPPILIQVHACASTSYSLPQTLFCLAGVQNSVCQLFGPLDCSLAKLMLEPLSVTTPCLEAFSYRSSCLAMVRLLLVSRVFPPLPASCLRSFLTASALPYGGRFFSCQFSRSSGVQWAISADLTADSHS